MYTCMHTSLHGLYMAIASMLSSCPNLGHRKEARQPNMLLVLNGIRFSEALLQIEVRKAFGVQNSGFKVSLNP